MKIHIDTEDFFTTRRIAWFLFIVAAVVIIFHLGMWAGYCKAQHRFYKKMRQMHGQEMMFNVQAAPGMMRVMKMHDDMNEQRVIYFKSQ